MDLQNLLTREQQIKFELWKEFYEEAPKAYNFIVGEQHQMPKTIANNKANVMVDGVYYKYADGSFELFDYTVQNKPTKDVVGIAVHYSEIALVVTLKDKGDFTLVNNDEEHDDISFDRFFEKYDDAVQDSDGLINTEYIKQIGTDIPLGDNEWIPSVRELYIMFLNKRSINAALKLAGGEELCGWYWSSTQNDATLAWLLDFSDGALSWGTKATISLHVRAVSAIL